MKMNRLAHLDCSHLQGGLFQNESLSPYTSWRVGGPADYLYKPISVEDLSLFLSLLPQEEQVIFFGSGTNILVRDGGIRGTVIVVRHLEQELRQVDERVLFASASVGTSKLGYFASQLSLMGLECLVGIPGTLGGALAMNAGAYGGEVWDHVIKVETIDRQGKIASHYADEYQIGYRCVTSSRKEWFTGAYFSLKKGDKNNLLKKIKENVAKRCVSQPLGYPNAGSVFRNPKGESAARLIQESHLKGYRLGGAVVSKKHANFIINHSQATASNIEQLIEHVSKVVFEKQGVLLEREVRILGEEG